MKISNIGPIKNAEISINELTVFCGGNNQGKTYLSYTVYAVLNEIVTKFQPLSIEILQKLFEGDVYTLSREKFNTKFKKFVKELIEKRSSKILEQTFNTKEGQFNNSTINIDEEEIIQLLNLKDVDTYEASVDFQNRIFTFTVKEHELIFSCVKHHNIDEREVNSLFSSFIFELLISNYLEKKIDVMYFPAERTGINVFAKELNSIRAQNLKKLQEQVKDATIAENLFRNGSTYPKPIDDYVQFVNDLKDYSEITNRENLISNTIRENMVGGSFGISEKDNTPYLKLANNEAISLHIASSSAKSLFGLDYYLDSIFGKDYNSYLIIDEPEINLHPKNQIKFAELINEILKSGVKVILSTHSDFLLKKILNISMENEYNKGNGIKVSNTNIYDVSQGKVTKIDYLQNDGEYSNFDEHFQNLSDEYFEILDKTFGSEEIVD